MWLELIYYRKEREIFNMATKKTTATKKTVEEVKSTPVKKTETPKKAEPVKKATAKKAAPKKKTEVYVQCFGKEYTTDEIVAKVTDTWVAEGKKKSEIKTLEVYVKPEDGKAYYVINGVATGEILL